MRSWETTWLQIAFCMSQRSRDPRLRVGCVIVRDDRHIEGIGYNGDEIGGANVPESLEPGLSGFVVRIETSQPGLPVISKSDPLPPTWVHLRTSCWWPTYSPSRYP